MYMYNTYIQVLQEKRERQQRLMREISAVKDAAAYEIQDLIRRTVLNRKVVSFGFSSCPWTIFGSCVACNCALTLTLTLILTLTLTHPHPHPHPHPVFVCVCACSGKSGSSSSTRKRHHQKPLRRSGPLYAGTLPHSEPLRRSGRSRPSRKRRSLSPLKNHVPARNYRVSFECSKSCGRGGTASL
jgi:hypothetical protein